MYINTQSAPSNVFMEQDGPFDYTNKSLTPDTPDKQIPLPRGYCLIFYLEPWTLLIPDAYLPGIVLHKFNPEIPFLKDMGILASVRLSELIDYNIDITDGNMHSYTISRTESNQFAFIVDDKSVFSATDDEDLGAGNFEIWTWFNEFTSDNIMVNNIPLTDAENSINGDAVVSMV